MDTLIDRLLTHMDTLPCLPCRPCCGLCLCWYQCPKCYHLPAHDHTCINVSTLARARPACTSGNSVTTTLPHMPSCPQALPLTLNNGSCPPRSAPPRVYVSASGNTVTLTRTPSAMSVDLEARVRATVFLFGSLDIPTPTPTRPLFGVKPFADMRGAMLLDHARVRATAACQRPARRQLALALVAQL